jgi:hypothetical protein
LVDISAAVLSAVSITTPAGAKARAFPMRIFPKDF